MIAVLLLSQVLLGCSRAPDEAALRQTIADMQAAAEERSPAGVVDHIAADFGGSDGLDRERLRRLLQAQMLANASVGATIGPISIERVGDRATARFSLVLTGGSGRFVPERGRAYRIESGWRIEDGEWKVYYADWRGDD